MAKSKKRDSYGKLKFGQRPDGYTYFYHSDQWEKARKSAKFLAWANGQPEAGNNTQKTERYEKPKNKSNQGKRYAKAKGRRY